MNRLFPIERRLAAAVGPLARGVLRLLVPGKEVFDSIQGLYGVEDLKNLRDLVFGELDPTQMFYAERVEEVLKVDGGYQLRVKLPFAHGQDLSITEAGNEVVVHIGHYRRNIMLPQLLAPMFVSEARLDQDMLTLSFKGARKGQTASKTTKSKR